MVYFENKRMYNFLVIIQLALLPLTKSFCIFSSHRTSYISGNEGTSCKTKHLTSLNQSPTLLFSTSTDKNNEQTDSSSSSVAYSMSNATTETTTMSSTKIPANSTTAVNGGTTTTYKNGINSTSASAAIVTSTKQLQDQATALRAEIEILRQKLDDEKASKIAKRNANIDKWIDRLLINQTVTDDIQLLNTVEQVKNRMKDDRFSQEQINQIFERICETSGRPQSRSNCSPIISLLVDAAGELDQIEREDNPNKRWNGRVERELRKRLFAMDWGIKLGGNKDDDDDTYNPNNR